MRYTTRYRYSGYNYSAYFPFGLKWLLISNTAIFVLSYLSAGTQLGRGFLWWFALTPELVLKHLAVWQPATYMFLHGGVWHLLFNMLTLWMFGMDLERDWGTRRFVRYYFLCGIGAGICDVLVNALRGDLGTHTIGASGAIYGILLAYGVSYPDRIVLFMFLFPIKAKYMVMIFGAIAFLNSLGSSGSGVSNVAHLGGMIFGYASLKLRYRPLDWGYFRREYRDWKLRRAKKKFQLYLKKHGSPRDPGVN